MEFGNWFSRYGYHAGQIQLRDTSWRGISCCSVGVCVLSRVGVLSQRMDGSSWYLAQMLFAYIYLTLCCKEIRLPPKQGYFCLQVCFKLWTLEISQQHSFTPGLKLSFSANPSHHSLPFLLLDWLHGFPGLFTDTSEHIRFFLSALPVLHYELFPPVD